MSAPTDANFRSMVAAPTNLTASGDHDGSIKVKVTGLLAGTTYYYRFIYDSAGQHASRTGRTRTARAPDADVPARFAVLNCQDYIGRYWNTTQRLVQLDLDLDFVVAIGDYIYETTGNESFQSSGTVHAINFTDPGFELLPGSSGTNFYAAARTVDNYRQLYRTYRSDKQLQALHEKYAFIAIWDDHEFSDDCWGDVGTYRNGRVNEKDTERRKNAEQAFFEFMPIDDGSAGGAFDTPASALFPNAKIWRNFQFGKHLELIMSDFRSFRPDHLIPEDAFPGTVVIDKNTIDAAAPAGTYDALSQSLFAVINIDDAANASTKAALLAALPSAYVGVGLSAADASAKAAAVVKGKLAVVVVNSVLAQLGLPALATDGLDKGIAFAQIGKQTLMDSIGSRYLVVKPLFDLYAGIKYAGSAKASENAWGDAQEAFIKQRLTTSDRSWKVLVSSVSFTSMTLDLRQKTALPALLRQQFYFDVDHWDGFPTKRREFYGFLTASNVKNTIFVCGDIHAGFVGKVNAGAGNDLAVITSPAISSGTLQQEIASAAAALNLGAAGAGLVAQLDAVLKDSNTEILTARTDQHGFAVVEVGATGAKATLHLIPAAEITNDYSSKAGDLAGKFTTADFNIAGGVITAA